MAISTSETEAAVLPPIIERPNLIGWLRRNLFNSPLNSILTLLIAWLLWETLVPLINWTLIDAVWFASNKEECLVDGVKLVSVTANQPLLPRDVATADARRMQLRIVKGRVYNLTYRAIDASDNTSQLVLQVQSDPK